MIRTLTRLAWALVRPLVQRAPKAKRRYHARVKSATASTSGGLTNLTVTLTVDTSGFDNALEALKTSLDGAPPIIHSPFFTPQELRTVGRAGLAFSPHVQVQLQRAQERAAEAVRVEIAASLGRTMTDELDRMMFTGIADAFGIPPDLLNGDT